MAKRNLPGSDRIRHSHFFFPVVFLLIFGCSSKEASRVVFQPRNDSAPVKIAVVPFQRVIPDDTAKTVRCPLTGIIYRSCASAPAAEKILEKTFLSKMARYERNLIPMDRVEGIYRRISSDSFKTAPREVLLKVGRELKADYVIAGYLFCFRERQGYSYSVEKPALVSFGIYMIRTNDGVLAWKGVFDKAQRSLLEDVFQLSSFIREKGRWVPAGELLDEGVDDVLRTFPEIH
ncbi:MAG: hypothetical protein ACE14T_05425 [Syntrophales bacterium]